MKTLTIEEINRVQDALIAARKARIASAVAEREAIGLAVAAYPNLPAIVESLGFENVRDYLRADGPIPPSDQAYAVQSRGQTKLYPSYDAAVDACRGKWPSAVIGHPGDLADGGERTLVWETEAESINDAGARACATILRVDSQ